MLTSREFVELEDGEEQEEEVRVRTDEEIVQEVAREAAQRDGKIADKCEEGPDPDSDDEEQVNLAEMMDAATKLENGAAEIGGCGSELSALCRKFRVELRRAMNREAQQLCHAPGWGHIVLHYVTSIILHNAENALEFRGNRHYALLHFLLYHKTEVFGCGSST